MVGHWGFRYDAHGNEKKNVCLSKAGHYLSLQVTNLLVHTFITSELDQCKSHLYRELKQLLTRPKHVQVVKEQLVIPLFIFQQVQGCV